MAIEYIYALIDPITNEPRYVGRTNDPETRYKLHLAWKSESNNTPKRQWVAALLQDGVRPLREVLEEVSSETADTAESKWICDYIDRGYKLTNTLVAAKYLRDKERERLGEKEWRGRKAKSNNFVTTSIRISPEMMDKIRELAKQEYRSVHSMILVLLKHGIAIRDAMLSDTSGQ